MKFAKRNVELFRWPQPPTVVISEENELTGKADDVFMQHLFCVVCAISTFGCIYINIEIKMLNTLKDIVSSVVTKCWKKGKNYFLN